MTFAILAILAQDADHKADCCREMAHTMEVKICKNIAVKVLE